MVPPTHTIKICHSISFTILIYSIHLLSAVPIIFADVSPEISCLLFPHPDTRLFHSHITPPLAKSSGDCQVLLSSEPGTLKNFQFMFFFFFSIFFIKMQTFLENFDKCFVFFFILGKSLQEIFHTYFETFFKSLIRIVQES